MIPSNKQAVRAGKPTFVSDQGFIEKKQNTISDCKVYRLNRGVFEEVVCDPGDTFNDNNTFAYVNTSNDGSEKYYIKFGAIGRFRGQLVDPWGVVSYSEHSRDYSTFLVVKEKTFLSYVNYLKTKNRIHYDNAERSLS